MIGIVLKNLVLNISTPLYAKQYILPKAMEDNYAIYLYAKDINSSNNIILHFNAKNGVWRIDSTNYDITYSLSEDNTLQPNDTIIINDTRQDVAVKLEVSAISNKLLSFGKYDISSLSEIRIGRSSDCHINFSRGLVDVYAKIRIQKGESTLEAYTKDIYLNNKNLEPYKQTPLRVSDALTIFGVMFVFLGDVIAFNNPGEMVRVKRDMLHELKAIDTDSTGRKKSMFGDLEYFKRSPRIMARLAKDDIILSPPPAKREPDFPPLFYSMAPSIFMFVAMVASLYFRSSSSAIGFGAQIGSYLFLAASAVGTIFVPLKMRKYQENKIEKSENIRSEKYMEYLKNKENLVKQKLKNNKNAYEKNYLEVNQCKEIALFKNAEDKPVKYTENPKLWLRSPNFSDFLDIRIGIGARMISYNIVVPPESFSVQDDELKYLAQKFYSNNQYIENIPVSVSFSKEYIIGIIGNQEININFVKMLILQISTTHAYSEAKIAIIYDKAEQNEWTFCKWLPHCWTDDRKQRFVASSLEDANEILLSVKSLVETRKMEKNAGIVHIPHFIIFIKSMALFETLPISQQLLNEEKNLGISFVFIQEYFHLLPNQCRMIIQNSKSKSSYYSNDDETNKMYMFKRDILKSDNMDLVAKTLFNTRIFQPDESGRLPDNLSFLAIFKAANIEMLKIKERWQRNFAYKRLDAPIGVTSDGSVFSLNIHEKFHGPHGLIAGMTGSGKSEFIQSFILGLCVNYDPDEIAFILIDYKGGGMADNFQDLPHLAGTVTNLSGNQINRSLKTLKSEVQKREKLFREYDINHINLYQEKYHELKKNHEKDAEPKMMPLPYLIIICDEFAELKDNHRAFMNDLNSIARTGRSLGIHLILATQKPNGVVDDQIWGNSRFRVCLKVLDKADSNAMIKRPEASTIVLPGRAYIQVGNDEIFEMVQSGYSGERYVKKEELEDEENSVVHMIENSGKIHSFKFREDKRFSHIDALMDGTRKDETQVKAIVKYLKKLSDEEGHKHSPLWCQELKNEIYLPQLTEFHYKGRVWDTHTDSWLTAVVGTIDDVDALQQPALSVDFYRHGHLAVYGLASSGKTTFLQTLLYSLIMRYPPDFLNIYILDFVRTFNYFKEAPHVGDVIFSDEEDKIKKFFKMIQKEMSERKEYFNVVGARDLKGYLEEIKNLKDEKRPEAIVIIIHNFREFADRYTEYSSIVQKLAMDATSYGIYLVVTASSIDTIPRKILNGINYSFAFQLKERYEYSYLFSGAEIIIPDKVPGRGVFKQEKVLEFQTALAVEAESDVKRRNILAKEFEDMKNLWSGKVAESIMTIPDAFYYDLVSTKDNFVNMLKIDKLPIGIDKEEIEWCCLDFKADNHFLIIEDSPAAKENVVKIILHVCSQKRWQSYLMDISDKASGLRALIDPEHHFGKREKIVSFLNLLAGKSNGIESDESIVVLIENVGVLYNEMSESEWELFESIYNNVNGRIYFVVVLPFDRISGISGHPVDELFSKCGNGIVLGEDANRQRHLSINLSHSKIMNKVLNENEAFFIQSRCPKHIKIPVYRQSE